MPAAARRMGSMLAKGLRSGALQAAVDSMEVDAAVDEQEQKAVEQAVEKTMEAFGEGDDDWSGELDFQEFIEAFRNKPKFVRKVHMATEMPEQELKDMTGDDLEKLFHALKDDKTDYSTKTTLTIQEFVNGLVLIRRAREAEKREEQAEEEEAILDNAYMDAAEAFEDTGILDGGGEMDLQQFADVLTDPDMVAKIQMATELPDHFFQTLTVEKLTDLFDQIDEDGGGTVSMQEWVQALVRIRQAIYVEEKAQEAEAKEEVAKFAEEIFEEGDEDWSGEFEQQEFIDAFSNNPRFLLKVALATGMDVDDLQAMDEDALQALFQAIDADASGKISFEEFIAGLVRIRLAVSKKKDKEDREEEAMVTLEAELDAQEAFADFSDYEDMDLHTFMEAMTDTDTLDKVCMATKLPLEYLQNLAEDEIRGLFEGIDTDCSGTVSMDEWVKALVGIRQSAHFAEKEEQRVLKQSQALAQAAYADADLALHGELTVEVFIKAFATAPKFVERVALAADIPIENLLNLTVDDLKDFFAGLDTDQGGTVDFDEFVRGLVQFRKTQYEALVEEGMLADETAMLGEAAFDSVTDADEMDIATFIKAFATNRSFLARVAQALDMPEDDLAALSSADLNQLFGDLDTDMSGTVSFDEFVRGLVEIRLSSRFQVSGEGGDDDEPTGPKPKQLSDELKSLPALDEAAKQRAAEVYAKYDPKGVGMIESTAKCVSALLQDLCLVVDERCAKGFIERAFVEPDLSWGFSLEDCEILYRLALASQPLWCKPLVRTKSAAEISGSEMRGQEERLREVFGKRAGARGAVDATQVGGLLGDIGLMDHAAYTPRFLDGFLEKRKPGPVRFPEVVDLCNATMDHMLLRAPHSEVKTCLSETLRANEALLIRKARPPINMMLPPLQAHGGHPGFLPFDAVGSPAHSLRRKKRWDKAEPSFSKGGAREIHSSSGGRGGMRRSASAPGMPAIF